MLRMAWLALLSFSLLGAADAWQPPEDLSSRLDEAYRDAVAHGLPDLSRGTITMGEVTVQGIAPAGLRLDQSLLDYGNPGRNPKTRDVTFRGWHLRLDDGSWLLGSSILVLPGDGWRIDPHVQPWDGKPAAEHTMMMTSPEIAARRLVDPGLAGWSDDWPALVPLTGGWNVISSCQSTVFWAKGLPHAVNYLGMEAASYVLASRLSGPPDVLRLFPDRLLDAQRDNEAQIATLQGVSPIAWPDIDLVAALRRGILRCWLGRAMRGQGVQQAIAEVQRLGVMLPNDRFVPDPATAGRIGQALLLTVPAPSEQIADRLVDWKPAMARPMARPPTKPASDFHPEDLPALAALVTDSRPTTWMSREIIEFGRPYPRHAGDNALRAIADVLHLDPRWLVDADPRSTWTVDERQRVGKALVDLMPAGSTPDIPTLIARAVPRLGMQDLAYALSGMEAARRTPILDAIATSWRRQPDLRSMQNHEEVAAVLGLAGPHPAIRAAVAGWGDANGNPAVVALYLANCGDDGPLDRLLARMPDGLTEADQSDSVEPTPGYRLCETMVAVGSHPTPARIDAVLAWCATDSKRLLNLLSTNVLSWSGAVKMLSAKPENGTTSLVPGSVPAYLTQAWPVPPASGEAADAVYMAIVAKALADVAPITPDDIEAVAGGFVSLKGINVMVPVGPGADDAIWNPKAAAPDGKPATDIRVCDVAAAILVRWPHYVRWLEGEDGGTPAFDLREPLAARENTLAGWRIELTKRMRTAYTQAGFPRERLPELPHQDLKF